MKWKSRCAHHVHSYTAEWFIIYGISDSCNKEVL